MRRLTLVAILGFGILLLFGCGERQASITGVVTDSESGNPLRDAIVTLGEHAAKTGVDGHYHLDKVPPGSYTLTARMEGYKPYDRQIDAQGNQEVILDITLSPLEEPTPLPIAEEGQGPHRVIERISLDVSPREGGSIVITEAESIYSNGFTLSIPPGAVGGEMVITVGDVTNDFPPIPNGLRPVGLPISLEPHGVAFQIPVTVKIPYSDEMLAWAGITSPEGLLLKTYDLSTNEWTDVPIVQVDTQNGVIVAEIDHFSLFSLFSWWNRKETENPATDKQILTYINDSWGVVAAVDDLLQRNSNTGIPFKDEIGGILTVMAMAEQVQNEKYRKAAIAGGEWLAWQVLKAAGYGWLRPFALLVEVTYKGGEWFVKELDKGAFNAQICAYLYYRQEEYSVEDIKDLFITDDGWVLTAMGTGCPPGYPRLTGRFKPEDVFRIGELVWDAKQSGSYKQRDTESIRDAFIDAIRPVEPNRPPQVGITSPSEEAIFAAGEVVNLEGRAVDPEDGQLTGSSLTWRIETDGGSRVLGEGEVLSLRDLSVGSHKISLAAKDSQGETVEDSIEITVHAAANMPPEVAISTPSDGSVFQEGEPIQFVGSAIDPEDGSLEGSSLIWVSGIDGVLGPGHTVTRDDLSPGTHAITLSATDSHSVFSTKTVTIVIKPSTHAKAENMPPEVTIATPSDGSVFQEGEPIQFVGSAIDPEDGSLEGSSLIWVDGGWVLESGKPLGIGSTLTRDDLQPGAHAIFLLAMDSSKGIAHQVVRIVIAPRPSVPPEPPTDFSNKPPTAYAGPDQRVCVGTIVYLNGSGSSDPDADRLSFEWTQISGPSVEAANWTAEELTFAPVEAGTYTFQLTVNDGQADSEASEVVVVLIAQERQQTDWLVVWEKRGEDSGDIYGARISQTGDLLDQNGFGISVAPGDQLNPEVVSGTEHWLVLWEDARDGKAAIYGARISQETGELLDPIGFLVAASADTERNKFGDAFSTTFDGENWLVVWQDIRETSLYFTRISPTGEVLDLGGQLVISEAWWPVEPATAFSNGNTLLAWSTGSGGSGDLYAMRLDKHGKWLDPNPWCLCDAYADQEAPLLVASGSHWLATWSDDREESGTFIYSARVTQDNEVVNPNGFLVALGHQLHPNGMASDGNNCIVVWTTKEYHEESGVDYRVYAALVDESCVVEEPVCIANPSGELGNGSVSFNGENFLVVWMEDQNGEHLIQAVRVDPRANVVDQDVLPVGSGGMLWGYNPTVASAWSGLSKRGPEEEKPVVCKPVVAPGDIVREYWILVAQEQYENALDYVAPAARMQAQLDMTLAMALDAYGSGIGHVFVGTLWIEDDEAVVEATLYFNDGTSKVVDTRLKMIQRAWRIVSSSSS